jgi:hypothetical protein
MLAFSLKLHGVKAGDADVGELATSAVNDLYASLSGIKDGATAQAALSEFDKLTGLVGQLPPNARKLLADNPRLRRLRPVAFPGWTVK